MNKHDQKQFDERYKDPGFHKLYIQLTELRFRAERELGAPVTTSQTIKARDLKEGKPMTLVLVASLHQAQSVQAKIALVEQKAVHIARKMSAYFPIHRCWHWQAIFLRQAFGSAGTVGQEQRGGRKPGQSETMRKERRRLALDYEETIKEYIELDEPPLSQADFVENRKTSKNENGDKKYKHCSLSTLQRGLRELDRERKRRVKQST